MIDILHIPAVATYGGFRVSGHIQATGVGLEPKWTMKRQAKILIA